MTSGIRIRFSATTRRGMEGARSTAERRDEGPLQLMPHRRPILTKVFCRFTGTLEISCPAVLTKRPISFGRLRSRSAVTSKLYFNTLDITTRLPFFYYVMQMRYHMRHMDVYQEKDQLANKNSKSEGVS